MDEKKRSIDATKPLGETEASSKTAKHTGNEEKYEEESDDPHSARAPSNGADDTSSTNRILTVKAGHSSDASTSCNPPTAEGIAALQSKSKWLPVGVIVEHILPLLDRVSWNRLGSTNKELYAASREVNPPWPFRRRLHADRHAYLHYLAFSPNGELLAGAGSDEIIYIWDRADGRCTHLERHDGVNCLHFSPDGKLLASGATDDRTIRLWKLEDRSYRVLEGHDADVMTVAFSPDGLTLVSGDCDGGIRLWNVNDGRCIRELGEWSFDRICSITFAPDGETIASAAIALETEDEDQYGAILLWDISDTDAITFTTVVERHDGVVHSLEYSPDGRYFASGAHDGTVRLWNTADSSCARVMAGDSPVFSVAFSPNGKLLASSSADGSVQLWSVEDGSCLVQGSLLGYPGRVASSVAFSPDGQTLASCSRGGIVRLWNPHEEDRKQFHEVDWETVFLLWNFRKE
jgi:WD40 repeat protein